MVRFCSQESNTSYNQALTSAPLNDLKPVVCNINITAETLFLKHKTQTGEQTLLNNADNLTNNTSSHVSNLSTLLTWPALQTWHIYPFKTQIRLVINKPLARSDYRLPCNILANETNWLYGIMRPFEMVESLIHVKQKVMSFITGTKAMTIKHEWL